MGCSIHAFMEGKKDGKYFYCDSKGLNKVANYSWFGILAGVRTTGIQLFEVKGIPDDVSAHVRDMFDNLGVDAHTGSFVTLEELKTLSVKGRSIPVAGVMDKEQHANLQASVSEGKPDWKLLYPHASFENEVTDKKVAFKFDVPLKNFIEKPLKNWIRELTKVEKNEDLTDARVVFYFDN